MKTLLKTLLLLAGLLALQARAAEPKNPNIVVILVDDMGFSDIGCYGSEIRTPNLDSLAAGGLRFTQFYNTARCCPTRAALLTGLYSHQAGMGGMVVDGGVDGYRGDLNGKCVTIADVLRSSGYSTYMTGKWHLTKAVGPNVPEDQKSNWPLQRGFDHYFGIIDGKSDYFHPGSLTRDNTQLPAPGDNFYTTDAFVENAIKFIDAGPKEKPFFLYLAFNAPHFPLMAPPEDIARYRGKYKGGWDKLREERHAKQLSLGLLDKAWPVSPRATDVKAWDSLTAEEQDRFDHLMAIYAACVDRMDRAVGKLVADLKSRGELNNTLILFMSDNGGNAEGGPGGRSEGSGPLGASGSNVFCGESWANAQNTPFRLYKHYNHEGGISTPLIAHWPAGIAARGEFRQQPGHLIDIMATCVEISGAKYPSEFKGQPILPMEGKSLLPAFADKPIERDALYWEHEGNAAVRAGDSKLVRKGRNGEWELYDLKADRSELSNLASIKPDEVKRLASKWDAWAARAQVIPYPKPKPGKKAEAGKNPDKAPTPKP
jgi:arylsulfatase A-like enzyme